MSIESIHEYRVYSNHRSPGVKHFVLGTTYLCLNIRTRVSLMNMRYTELFTFIIIKYVSINRHMRTGRYRCEIPCLSLQFSKVLREACLQCHIS